MSTTVLSLVTPQPKYCKMLVTRVIEAADGTEALDLLETHRFDLMLTDILMSNFGGFALANRVHAQWPELPIILTGYLVNNTGEAILNGPVEYLQKPIDASHLIATVQRMLTHITSSKQTMIAPAAPNPGFCAVPRRSPWPSDCNFSGLIFFAEGSSWDIDAPLDVQLENKERLTCLSYRRFPIQHGQILHFYEEQLCFVKIAAVFMSSAEAGQLPWESFRL